MVVLVWCCLRHCDGGASLPLSVCHAIVLYYTILTRYTRYSVLPLFILELLLLKSTLNECDAMGCDGGFSLRSLSEQLSAAILQKIGTDFVAVAVAVAVVVATY